MSRPSVERAAAADDLKIRGLREEGKRSGLPYRILVGPSGNLNGYVGVPENHPWFGKGYDETLCGHDGCYLHTTGAKIDVHGGLTFAGKSEQSKFWWFGFDTAHSCDDPRFGGTTKDINYVRAECNKLAKQLSEIVSSATGTATTEDEQK